MMEGSYAAVGFKLGLLVAFVTINCWATYLRRKGGPGSKETSIGTAVVRVGNVSHKLVKCDMLSCLDLTQIIVQYRLAQKDARALDVASGHSRRKVRFGTPVQISYGDASRSACGVKLFFARR